MGKAKYIEVPKNTLEKIAHILGPSSAAQKALNKAKDMKAPRFFKSNDAIICIETG